MNKSRSYRLYIAGDISNEESSVLVDSLIRGLSDLYGEDYELEVKNVFSNDNAEHAITDGIFSIPSLLRLLPKPAKQIVGKLVNTPTSLLLLHNGEMPA